MQYPFSCTPAVFAAIESTLSQPRLGRYLPASGSDRHLALRLYIWNARLCEEFYIPTQIVEIAVRNVLARGLTTRYGPDWHVASAFTSGLPARLQRELAKVIAEEQALHGATFTADHVISGMSLGFWVHLTSAQSRRYVWRDRLHHLFPGFPSAAAESDIHTAADQLRRFRNRIAHHNAVFDRSPTGEYRNIQNLLEWICPDTLWLVRQLSNPARVISRRPR